MASNIKCSKCGHIGPESDYKVGNDFMQNKYIAACTQEGCNNRQSPGDASMRMFMTPEPRPFSYVDLPPPLTDDLKKELTPMEQAYYEVMRRSMDAS